MEDQDKNSIIMELLEGEDSQLFLDNIRTVSEKFQDKLAQLSILRELGNILHNINDFHAVCSTIMDIIIANTVARNCSIMLLDFDQDRLFLVAATNPDGRSYIVDPSRIFSKQGLKYTFSRGEGAAGRALATKQPVLIDDVSVSDIFDEKNDTMVPIGTLLCVPMIIENEACGVFTLSHPDRTIFRTNDVNLFSIVSNTVSLALNSALSYETLRYSEEKYRALAEYSNDGITILQDGMHRYANPSYKSLTGYTFRELQEIPLEDLITLADTNTAVPIRMNPLHSDIPGTFEAVLANKNGHKLEVEISHASFLYMGRHAKILSLRDLRERKELEFKLQQAQKMEALGVIAGGVAHDLNNILSGITSYPDLLLMDMPMDSPLRKPISTIKKSGEKAIATVQDLLTLARRGASVMEIVNLNSLIQEYLESPEHRKIKSHHENISFITRFEAEELNIKGSPYHLNKSIMNLALNAAEAIDGKGTISIITENRYMDKPLQGYELIGEGDFVTLSISDTGSGISSEEMEKLFEPFYTRKKFGRSGTGLGLPVVWGTVKDHNGFIDVQSIQGKGTTFTLYFPVNREELSPKRRELTMDEYMGGGQRILVVDDVMEQRDIATMMLQKLGYRVTAVSSGEEAVEYVSEHEVDLLLLDMIMEPGIDGLETYRRVLKIRPGLKAVITSGFSETQRVIKAQALGAKSYIKKPYFLEKLGITVKNALKN
ncbi:MAG TPA: response regulator [Deltaproteobacteria bacterium]|nr:response regulator [Deltaproteobacteria bacterium]